MQTRCDDSETDSCKISINMERDIKIYVVSRRPHLRRRRTVLLRLLYLVKLIVVVFVAVVVRARFEFRIN